MGPDDTVTTQRGHFVRGMTQPIAYDLGIAGTQRTARLDGLSGNAFEDERRTGQNDAPQVRVIDPLQASAREQQGLANRWSARTCRRTGKGIEQISLRRGDGRRGQHGAGQATRESREPPREVVVRLRVAGGGGVRASHWAAALA